MNITFNDWTVEQLNKMNFQESFALFVFHGVAGTGGYRATVQEIKRQGRKVVVQAEFSQPQAGRITRMAVTSSYHWVQVSKEDLAWNQEIQFILEKEGKQVAKTVHFIP